MVSNRGICSHLKFLSLRGRCGGLLPSSNQGLKNVFERLLAFCTDLNHGQYRRIQWLGKGEGKSQKEWWDRKVQVREERKAKRDIGNKERVEREVRGKWGEQYENTIKEKDQRYEEFLDESGFLCSFQIRTKLHTFLIFIFPSFSLLAVIIINQRNLNSLQLAKKNIK